MYIKSYLLVLICIALIPFWLSPHLPPSIDFLCGFQFIRLAEVGWGGLRVTLNLSRGAAWLLNGSGPLHVFPASFLSWKVLNTRARSRTSGLKSNVGDPGHPPHPVPPWALKPPVRGGRGLSGRPRGSVILQVSSWRVPSRRAWDPGCSGSCSSLDASEDPACSRGGSCLWRPWHYPSCAHTMPSTYRRICHLVCLAPLYLTNWPLFGEKKTSSEVRG